MHYKIYNSYFVLWFFYRLNLWMTLNCQLALNLKKHWLQNPLPFPKKVCGELAGVGGYPKPCFERISIAFGNVRYGWFSLSWSHQPQLLDWGHWCGNVIGSYSSSFSLRNQCCPLLAFSILFLAAYFFLLIPCGTSDLLILFPLSHISVATVLLSVMCLVSSDPPFSLRFSLLPWHLCCRSLILVPTLLCLEVLFLFQIYLLFGYTGLFFHCDFCVVFCVFTG